MIDKFNADRSKGVHNLNLFQDHYEPHLRQSALGMASLEHIDEKSLPDNMLNRFVNKDSSKYLLTLYPKESVWNLSFLERFTFQMKKFDERITGFPGVFFVLTHIIGKDRRNFNNHRCFPFVTLGFQEIAISDYGNGTSCYRYFLDGWNDALVWSPVDIGKFNGYTAHSRHRY